MVRIEGLETQIAQEIEGADKMYRAIVEARGTASNIYLVMEKI